MGGHILEHTVEVDRGPPPPIAICFNMDMMVGKAGMWRQARKLSSQPQGKQIGAVCKQMHLYSDALADKHKVRVKEHCLIQSFSFLPLGRPIHFPAVRLRGLPFDCCETDVLKFFWGFVVVDVLLMHNRRKRLSGEAYVVFSTPTQVSYACQKHGQTMHHRYIEVFNCGKEDYYRAIAAETRHQSEFRHLEHTGILKLRGLPFSATKNDIIQFFDQFKLADDDVHMILSKKGRTTGEACVIFASCFESKAAMSKDKMTLGERYIELFPISRDEVEKACCEFQSLRSS